MKKSKARLKGSNRPIRVLHVGNIANNAYNNAKIQRRYGIEADVICFDYYHIMSCPEWEDSGFDGEISDPFKPDWWSVDLKGFERPKWFAQGPVSICRKYLIAKQKKSILTGYYWLLLELSRWILLSDKPIPTYSFSNFVQRYFVYYPIYGVSCARYWLGFTVWKVRNSRSVILNKISIYLKNSESKISATLYTFLRSSWRSYKEILRRLRIVVGILVENGVDITLAVISSVVGSFSFLIVHVLHWVGLLNDEGFSRLKGKSVYFQKQIKSVFQKKRASSKGGSTRFRIPEAARKSDVEQYLGDLAAWKELYDQYDVIQAYSVDPIRPMLAGLRNYAAYEHGTIREIPFIDNPLGRLTKLCYQDAPIVFITNADNIKAARRLNLKHERVVYLPHAFDEKKLLKFKQEHADLVPSSDEPITFFSPSRQHWKGEDPSFSKCNDRFIRAFAAVCKENSVIHAKFVEWGEDLEDSKRLIDALGISDRVSWVPPMKKRQLWKEYMQAHAVVDQFLIPAIGGVTFEAMTLGKRVLTSIDVTLNTEFFGKTPEVLICSTEAEIEECIRKVVADPFDVENVGEHATNWIKERHSSKRVCDLQYDAYVRLLTSN